jgi:hypothetical protein
VGDVIVTVAQVGQLQSLEPALLLLDRQQVAQDLAGMGEIRQGVDDGHAGFAGHLLDVGVFEKPGHDHVHVPADRLDGVVQAFLAGPEGRGAGVVEDGVPAELGHARLEGNPRAKARLFEDHQERFAPHGVRVARGVLLDPARQGDHVLDLRRRPFVQTDQVLHGLLAVLFGRLLP